jgi:predicted helicase
MDSIVEGIVGVITNNSFIDNPTFRGMRQSLLASFDQIWILDLNGSTRRKGNVPGEVTDENVFDIEQGVAVTLLVKRPGSEKGVWHADLWGKRLDKYKSLVSTQIETTSWMRSRPSSPFYFLNAKPYGDDEQTYKTFRSIREIMSISVTGIVTARDRLAIGMTRRELQETIQHFLDCSEDLRLKDTRGWSIERAKQALRQDRDWPQSIQPVDYRPFDQRWIAYDRRLVDWGRWDLMPFMVSDNISLNSPLTKSGFVDSVGRSGGWAGVAGWRWDARAIDKAN